MNKVELYREILHLTPYDGVDFPMSKYQNVAIPVKTPLKQKGYCDILSPLLK